jgi:DNA-binding phage protein
VARLQEAQSGQQEGLTVALTKDFRETVRARAARDPKFRKALFKEAVQTLLQGDIDAGRSAIRDYINATLGFAKLSAALGRPQKSLMRMFGPGGNPTAENLLGVIGVLQTETGVHLKVRAVADAA